MRYRMLLAIAAVAVNAAGSVPPSAGLRTVKVSSLGSAIMVQWARVTQIRRRRSA